MQVEETHTKHVREWWNYWKWNIYFVEIRFCCVCARNKRRENRKCVRALNTGPMATIRDRYTKQRNVIQWRIHKTINIHKRKAKKAQENTARRGMGNKQLQQKAQNKAHERTEGEREKKHRNENDKTKNEKWLQDIILTTISVCVWYDGSTVLRNISMLWAPERVCARLCMSDYWITMKNKEKTRENDSIPAHINSAIQRLIIIRVNLLFFSHFYLFLDHLES